MDLLESLRSFCAVAVERSFTRGAERCGQPQPVASRRIAGLERRLGVPLLVRTSRQVGLTDHGEQLLPLARELINRADRIDRLFDQAGPSLVIAVPTALTSRARAAIRRGLPEQTVVFVEDGPAERIRQQADRSVGLALLPASAEEADIRVRLGIAHHDHRPDARFLLQQLRRPVRERDQPARTLHLRAEDAVPAVRDLVQTSCYRAGLRADQVAVGTEEAEAWTRMYERDDVILAGAEEARREAAAWSVLDEPEVYRNYRLHGSADLTTGQQSTLITRLAAGLGGDVVAAASSA